MNNLTLDDDLLAKSSWKVPKFRDLWRGKNGSDLWSEMHGEMRIMNGYPMGKDEVSLESQLLLGFGPWAENGKEKKIFGLFAPKPNISVN